MEKEKSNKKMQFFFYYFTGLILINGRVFILTFSLLIIRPNI